MKRFRVLSSTLAFLFLGSAALLGETIRWDIVSLQAGTVKAGGSASARTNDGLKITITGSGTFKVSRPTFTLSQQSPATSAAFSFPGNTVSDLSSVSNPDIIRDEEPEEEEVTALASTGVTGGGNFSLRDTNDNKIIDGTYTIKRLVRFGGMPGSFGATDTIGNAADARAGLAELEVEFSDKTAGIFVVSCHLTGTPDYVFEGIVISKGAGFFWNREAPAAGVDANRTLFHVMKK